jgi:acetamidase/formamidase
MKEHHLSAEPTHSVWDRSLPPRLHIDPGDEVQIACIDASGGQVKPGMTTTEYLGIDRTRIHALTGPVWIQGAEPGDVLEIDVLATQHCGWGWSSIVEGLGFLKDRFRTPYLFHWQLDGDTTSSLHPAVVPVRPFLGVMGVARGEDGAFRTRPPGPFGGNLDVRELCAGSRLYLPVYNPGALFSCGDGHAAQGDGEVDQTAIETSLRGRLRLIVHKGMTLAWPRAETPTDYISMGTDEDLTKATKTAIQEMVDFLAATKGMDKLAAYQLTSIAGNVVVTQLVDQKVGVHVKMPKAIFTKGQGKRDKG